MIKQTVQLQPGEAEELVKRIRHHLREAESHAQLGHEADEEKSREAANVWLERLLDGCKKKFGHYAHKFFGNKRHHLIQDVTQEIVIHAIEEVRRTDAIPHALFYEQNFKVAIEGCINNVLEFFHTKNAGYNDSPTRAYLREQAGGRKAGRRKEGIEDDKGNSNYLMPGSLNSRVQGDDGDGTEEQESFVADPLALQAIENVLTKEIWHAFKAELSPQDRILAEAIYSGHELQAAAKFAGVSVRTAHTRKNNFRKRLLQLFGLAENPGDFVDEAACELKVPVKSKSASRKRIVH